MKKLSILLIAILFCSLQGHAQFWISFGWNEPHCQNCLWMEQAIRMTNRQAAEYHKIIHRYGEKIEREARKHYRYWDQSARKIYKLRMERDRKLQRILSPSQFRHADCLFHPEAVQAMGFIPSETDPKLCMSLQAAKKDRY